MSRKQMLSRLVRFMLLLLVFGFFGVLFASLDTRIINRASDPESIANTSLFADIPAGQTQMRRHQSQRVWVTRLDQSLRLKLARLDDVLPNPEQGCALDAEFCLVVASTERSGIEIVYSLRPPPTLSADLPWVGGFTNPINGKSYDLLGRAYAPQDSGLKIAK